jgi:lysophospholipase L1-like esterase
VHGGVDALGHVRQLALHRVEVALVHHDSADRRRRDHARGASVVLDERDLTEEVAGAEIDEVLPVLGDLDRAGEQHEELVREGSLIDEVIAGGQVDHVGVMGDLLAFLLREVREQRHGFEFLGVHRWMMPRNGRARVARLGDGGVPERTNGTASKAVRGLNRPSQVRILSPPQAPWGRGWSPALRRGRASKRSSPPTGRPLNLTMDRTDTRPSFIVATLLVIALAMALAPRASAAEPPPRGRFAVGDSIMLSAKPELRELGFGVNAEVGRQFSAGVWVVRRKAEDGTLPKRVVVHLGTNGTISAGDCDRLIEHAGPRRRVFLTTIKVPRGWEGPNNDTLNVCANAHDEVHVIRWWSKSHDHPEWFADDGYHLNAEGQQVFASFVDRSVDAVLAELRAGAAR